MLSSLSLLAFVLLQISTSRASPAAPVSAPAISITTASLSSSCSTIVSPDRDHSMCNLTPSIQGSAFTSTHASPSTTALASPNPSLINIQPRADSSSVSSYHGNLLITYAPITTTGANGRKTTISASTPSGQGSFATPYAAPPPRPSSGLGVGAKAAIGTASVVVCIFLGFFLCCVCAQMRQRKSIKYQDPDGETSGAKRGMANIFSPRVGKPHDNYGEGKDANSLKDLKPIPTVKDRKVRQPSPADHQNQQQQSHGRQISQGNFHPPHSPTTSTAPVQVAMYSPVDEQGHSKHGR